MTGSGVYSGLTGMVLRAGKGLLRGAGISLVFTAEVRMGLVQAIVLDACWTSEGQAVILYAYWSSERQAIILSTCWNTVGQAVTF